MKRYVKRIFIDALGYLLILGGILLGWVPGPGGIPLILAGLGLLSIHNAWAGRLREYFLRHGGKLIGIIFPPRRFVQIIYDFLVVLLLIVSSLLARDHAAVWEVSAAVILFFLALFIAAMNRERYLRLKRKHK